MNSSYLLLVIGAVACFVQSANSIRCYQCTLNANGNDPECNNNKQEVDCTHYSAPQYIVNALGRANSNTNYFNNPLLTPSGCMKKTYETYDNRIVVERDCYFGNLDNTRIGCTPITQAGIRTQRSCDVCATDRCNSSTTILPTAISMLLVLSVAFLGKLFIL